MTAVCVLQEPMQTLSQGYHRAAFSLRRKQWPSQLPKHRASGVSMASQNLLPCRKLCLLIGLIHHVKLLPQLQALSQAVELADKALT